MAKSQQVVITIGHQSILLPDDTGAATIIKALSRGLPCYYWSGSKKVELLKRDFEVSMSYVPHGTKIVDEDDRPLDVKPASKSRPALPAPGLLTLMEGGRQ